MSRQPLPPDVTAALNRGNKIEAIKLLREATGLGLAEARHVIEARGFTGRTAPDAQAQAPRRGATEATMEAVQDAVRAGRKIEAIRLYREVAGVGLKEAKEAVDMMERVMPAQSAATFTMGDLAPGEVPRSAGLWGWVVAAVLLGLALYWTMAR